MEGLALARAIHVVCVVLWIGGVALVTTVVLPAAMRMASAADAMAFLQTVERRFAPQARVTTLLAGLSGFYMVYRFNWWDRFLRIEYWWMHTMVLIWLVFTLMLFVIEPLLLKRHADRMGQDSRAVLAHMARMHWILLVLSLLTIAGAVAGSHGYILSAS